MRPLAAFVLIAAAALAQNAVQNLPSDDAIRIEEFYRLASQIQDKVWPGWSAVPAPVLLVTDHAEFLVHYDPPGQFKRLTSDFYVRPRQFPLNLQATFPPFRPQPVIVIGEPKNTDSKTSTAWLITLMHEHFHQLQYDRPDYYPAVEGLGLKDGDTTGMWMLNYPFPYDTPAVAQEFANLRNLLLRALETGDDHKFGDLAHQYLQEREKFFSLLSPNDHKYFSFQLWQEGIARYVQIRSAEAAVQYQPTAQFAALPDYEPFSSVAAKARPDTLQELKNADLAKMKRLVAYSFGAAEALLLDRLNPQWKEQYFQHPLTTDPLFEK